MLWMVIWVHPCSVMPVKVRVFFCRIGLWLSPSDVVVSWLRL